MRDFTPGTATQLGGVFGSSVSFFFQAIAAFYVGKALMGLVFLFIDFLNLVLVLVGIGIITGLLFRLLAGAYAYSAARKVN